MSGAGASERPEERQRLVPPASSAPGVSGRRPPSRDPRGPHLRGPSLPLPLIAPGLSRLPGGTGAVPCGKGLDFGVGWCLGCVAGVTLCSLCPPQIAALGHGGVLQELVLGAGQPPDPGISEEQRQAREEWEALEEIQSGLGGTSGAAPPPISFTEALQHFQSAELSASRGKLRAPGRRGILAALLRCLRGPPRLCPQLRGEQELALAMAQCALDDSERVHMRILQTIYRQLTRSSLGCPRYGAHWEELGFQEFSLLRHVCEHHPDRHPGAAGGAALPGVQPAAAGDRGAERPARRRLPAPLPPLGAAARHRGRRRLLPQGAGIIHQKEAEAAAEIPGSLPEPWPSASLLTLLPDPLHQHL
ncbi:ELMO domain-containing protein 3 [Anomalospiza imberbis]|uniref:ELMO domain-containing protein 3 n=1 Tax=Anomalospiza imberbis TaxID=187417 RepID=UPI00358FE104